MAQTAVRIDLTKPGLPVSPTLYGLMTEEINYSYDGGLYAELVRNRVFKDDDKTPVHWSVVQDAGGSAAIALDQRYPVAATALTTSLRLDAARAAQGHRVGIANDGYWGIPVKPNTRYRASFYAKTAGAGGVPLTVSIEGGDGKTVYAQAEGGRINGEWKRYSVTLTTGAKVKPTADARLVIATESPGTVWFNQVSLFPPTYKDRPNGNRVDLMQKLVDMKPAFLRFPGGNYLEGETVATRFKWKETLGPIDQRPGHLGTWGYRSSDGMGLLEFLEWCEDMKAEPVLAVFAGYALRGETIPAGPGLQPFVQEALDEIEYVTGDVEHEVGRAARQGRPSGAVQAALRRDRQRGRLRQAEDLRRPLHPVPRRHQGEVPAAQADLHRQRQGLAGPAAADDQPGARPGRRALLLQRDGDVERRCALRQL